ncbi:MAG: TonB-dependent receptor plug domain-containing protein [Bacteroidales bacterium]|jgi:outer membrane cobalamin receptor|nr:TonB-dependent receptor plug domain-containing protein [Bacteroidales bacterium]
MLFNKAVCIGVLLGGAVAAAQEAADSVRRIEEVTVIADRYREVIPSQKLSGKKLEALGSFSVADAIRYFSGVQLKDYGGVGGLKTIDIRSMGTNHLGVFYDGIQLGNAQNGQIDLGKFSLDNIEEITLYNGQKSEILQSAKDFGASGTIYLRTRHPHFGKGETRHVKAIVRTGSFGLLNPSLLWEQKLGKVAASVNAEYVRASGKYKFRYRKVLRDGTVAWDTTAVRQNGDIRSVRLENGWNGPAGQGRWNAKAYFYDSERGIPGAIVNNVWKRSQRQWDRNFFMQGSYRNSFARNGEIIVNAKYANDRMRYLNPDTTLMYIDNTFRQQEIYTSVAGKYALLPQWEVSMAVDYQWNALDASLQDFVFPQRNTALVALATALRWKRLKAQASLLSTSVFERVGEASRQGKPQNRQRYTPAVFLSWQPFARTTDVRNDETSPLTLRAFYKHIFRMPTFNDLYYTDIGNVSLRPEYTTQYNIGFQYGRNPKRRTTAFNWKIQADAYYNEVTDKIIAVPKGNGQFRWMMMNLGYVKIRGLDLSGETEWQLPKDAAITTQLNYTFQKAQDFTNPADNRPQAGTWGGQIAYIPQHSGSAIVAFLWKTWEANYSFIYTGERYHNSSNIRENYEQPWYTHDMTVAKTFNIKKVKFKISAEINNLLNQFYDVVLNYPMPGRNYKLTLKMDL